ncbi:MAG: AAA family ATPase [Pseudomonadales bacterium]|jgi:type II secretory pathway predicted ATPase ExeA|nr:AAA family ATPase [Pseudomonadales bacterium]
MYENHFKLKEKPFRLTPDARFFFPSAQHKRALAFLEYGLIEGEGFIVITGDPGTGKSTLVSTLIAERKQDPLKVCNIETSRLSEENLLEMLIARFGLRAPRSDTKAARLETLRQELTRWHKAGKRALAIIDEAQNLPGDTVEELRMLSNLQGGNRPLLQTFLVGQSSFRERLEQPEFEQLRQRVTAWFHLGPFKAEEIKAYVQHRLVTSGWQLDPRFEASAWPAIHVHTGGIPRLINILADRLLLYCFLENAHEIDRRVVDLVAEETNLKPPRHLQEGPPPREARARPPAPACPPPREDTRLELPMALHERLSALEDRIKYTERRIRLDLSIVRRMLQARNGKLDD